MVDSITESFDLEKTNEYTLSIQISLDGFSFSVYNPQENKVVAFKSTLLKISSLKLISRHFEEWYSSEEILQKTYSQISLIYFTTEFSLIPENLFDSKLVEEATNNLIEEKELKTSVINPIEGLETPAKILFYIPANLNELVNQKFYSAHIIHPAQLIIKRIPESFKRNKVILAYNRKSSIIIACRNGQVLFANGFSTSHINDTVYYLLNTLMQLNLNLKETELFLTEALQKDEKLEELLQPYFSEISYLMPSDSIENSDLIPNSIHRYYPII